jgi:undecaprenyl diphosphate synthase
MYFQDTITIYYMKQGIFDRFPQLKQIPKEKFPKHVLIIPDGNGRWAQKMRQLPIFGHRQGMKIIKEVLDNLKDLPINTTTVWGFSANNWKRQKKEVNSLMKLFESAIKENLPELMKNSTRFIHLGRKDRIPLSLINTIEQAEKKTRQNTKRIFCLALDFGGEDQELRMLKEAQKLTKSVTITQKVADKLRDGKGFIGPSDLIIRTSGEQRTSDLGWLERNAEFYSIPKLLPESTIKDFVNAIIDYSRRERRLGGRIS